MAEAQCELLEWSMARGRQKTHAEEGSPTIPKPLTVLLAMDIPADD